MSRGAGAGLFIVSIGLAACGDDDAPSAVSYTVIEDRPTPSPMTLHAPSYWLLNGTPVRVTLDEDGVRIAERLDPRTGRWEERATLQADILYGEWVDEVTEEEFQAAVDEILRRGAEP